MVLTNVKTDQPPATKSNEANQKREGDQKQGAQAKPTDMQQKNDQNQNQGGGFRGGRGGFDNRGRGRGYFGGRGGRGGRFFNNQQQGGQQQQTDNSNLNNSQSSQGSQGDENQGGRGGFRGRGRGFGRGGGGERREKIVHPPPQFTESGERMFTGRCRLFVGNIPQDMNQEEFEKLFEPFGQYQEAFVNGGRGFGFIRMDLRENAVKAKKALDGQQMKGRFLRVRFASHSAAIRVKHLGQHVSNELLTEAFSMFGEIERAIVVIDEKGRSIGEGIVEFARKPGAMMALNRINDGVFLLGTSPRPVTVEPLVENDDEDGLPEKFLPRNNDYIKEREQGARLAPLGSFEYEFGHKWKEMYLMHTEAEENLKRQFHENVVKLEIEQANAQMEFQTQKLREDLVRRQEELRKMEENNQREMQLKLEMRRNQEENRRKSEELRKREEEEQRLKMERYQQQQDDRARQQHEIQLRELQEMRQMREELSQMRQQQRQLQQQGGDMGGSGGNMGGSGGNMGGGGSNMGGGGSNMGGGGGIMGAGPDIMGQEQGGRGIMGSRPDQGDIPAMKPPPAPPAVMLAQERTRDGVPSLMNMPNRDGGNQRGNRDMGNMGSRGNMDRGGPRQSRFEQGSGNGYNQGGMGGIGGRGGGMDRRDRPDDFFDAKRPRRF